jgi:ATP-dependent Clp protease ATP-binding subunit ClpC
MFERYTETARRVIFFARYEASQFGSRHIEPHHLLLGLLREAPSIAPEALLTAYTSGELRTRLEREFPARDKVSTSVDLPLDNPCKRVLAYAAEESERLNHRHIGAEHLLLGVMREEGSAAAQALHEYGITIPETRSHAAANMDKLHVARQLLNQVTDDRLTAAAQLLGALASKYVSIQAETAEGRFTITFGTPPEEPGNV